MNPGVGWNVSNQASNKHASKGLWESVSWLCVGGAVNLWGRNSDKWFTSRRWHHRLAPTPKRAFSFRSHLPCLERNKLGLSWNRRRCSTNEPPSASPPADAARISRQRCWFYALCVASCHRGDNYADRRERATCLNFTRLVRILNPSQRLPLVIKSYLGFLRSRCFQVGLDLTR